MDLNCVDVMNQPQKKKESVPPAKQQQEKKNLPIKLTEKQKRVFDSYIETRSIDKTARELEIAYWDCLEVYNSKNFQLAIREYNEEMLDKVAYNSAVIIDELWKTYGSEGIAHKDKINILTLLGKHIGMWATQAKDPNAKTNVQYNIVNYNSITGEIQKHEQEIIANVVEDDTPEGFKILTFDRTN